MRRSPWLWIALLAVAVVAVLWIASRELGAVSSTLSRDARGWLLARRYLEVRGAEVELRDAPLLPGAGDGVLALTFPWQRPLGGAELTALGDHLRRGGTVLVAYSREIEQYQEKRVLGFLRAKPVEVRAKPSLVPWEWWRYQRQGWELGPEPDWRPDAPTLSLPAFRRAPGAPEGALVWYRGGEDEVPIVFTYRQQGGRVVMLPADLFANAGILRAGNADLLATLFAWLGPEWIFDEYHHGLSSAKAETVASSRFAWDLFMLHLGLLYVLALVVLVRRFGPAWREAPVVAGSTAAFLRSLGTLHRQLGHHPAAARLLDERARLLDPHLPFPSQTWVPVDDDPSLVTFARKLARAQRRRTV